VIASTCFFLTLDTVLVTSCLLKFLHGGWFPIVLGAGIFTIMSTWKRGRQLLIEHIRRDDPKLEPFIEALRGESIPIVPRTAVFLVANADTVPQALLHNIKHNMVLHECNVMLTVVFREVPWVPFSERVTVEPIARGVWRVIVNYGFKNVPDVPQALELCAQQGLEVNLYETSYFISRETVIPTPDGGMAWWREQLFAAMSRNAGSVVEFFRIPSNSVIELGTRIQI
jgi:KUP system potassium uptake protein